MVKIPLKELIAKVKTRPLIVWEAVLIVSLLLLITSLFGRFVFGTSSRIEEAVNNGQHYVIELISHEAAVEIQQEAKKKEDEEKKEKELAVAKKKNEEMFGPFLPETSTIKLEKISIKELSKDPIIVIVVKGLGLSSSTTEAALELPSNVSLGFSPYSPSIKRWVSMADEEGHEVILNIPMETRDYKLDDPGPFALLKSSSKDDNITRLKMLLSLVTGYKAIYSEQSETFTQSLASTKPILDTLKKHGTYFLYGGGYNNFSFIQLSEEIDYPILVSDITIDDDIQVDSISRRLKEAEEHAIKKGFAVVMAHPYPLSVRVIDRWIPTLDEKNIKLAPISFLLGKSFK